MDEHDALEPTAAMPRVGASRAAEPAFAAPPVVFPAAVPPPLGRPPEFRVAGARQPHVFGNPFTYALRRLLAFGLDFIVVSAVATTLLYGLIAINPLTGLPTTSQGGFDATLGMGVAIALIYLWSFEAIFGTTLGKLAFSLHVYVPKHRFVGFGRAFVRNLVRPLDLLVIGAVLAMAPGHRRLGDLFGGTLVAQSPLRGFAPVIGWLLLGGLVALPFLIAGGMVTVVAVAAAFVDFVPPLIARIAHAAFTLFGSSAPHVPAAVPVPTVTG